MKNRFTILGSGSSLGSPWITNYSAKLKKNSKIKPQNFTIKQPQIGIPAKYINKLGKMKLKKDLKSDSVLKWEDIF